MPGYILCRCFFSYFLARSAHTEFSFVNFWYDTAKMDVSNRISQDILHQFSQSFHQMKAFWVQMIDLDPFSNTSRDVAMATNFGRNSQNNLHSASWRSETDRKMAVLIQNYSMAIYILCNSDQDRSSNIRDYEGNICIFSISRHMYGHYKTDKRFAVAQGTLLW